MANTFDGAPDARQLPAVDAPVSRFRPRYRSLNAEELRLHDAIKLQADSMDALFNQVAPGREMSIAYTKLEEAIMWAVKALTGAGLRPK